MKVWNHDLIKIMKIIKTKTKWGTISFPSEKDGEDRQEIRRERVIAKGRLAAFGEDVK